MLLTSVSLLANSVDTAGQARPRSGIDIRVTELMIHAMRARDMGDMNSAELFWIQARAYRPSMPRPAWLEQPPANETVVQPTISEDELIERIQKMPYNDAKVLLNDRLQKDPTNIKLRRLFLELSEKAGDHSEVSRHRSLVTVHSRTTRNILMYLFSVLIGFLLVWQIAKLINDLRSHL
ncbi:MAG: hypothetical protein CVV42_06935 [Candidatus Riflebacteria bacterium HGW-Riflebacteria-2]|jgi:hypothetical protein|nr:MAG: hypothetical protein CVV42_06935 [Candidatus Riflebacteria bacterium HGW-Riflebacteria-2]